MKVAIVCDWLTNVGGAEKVLLEIHRLYPEAPIYTSKYSPRGIDWFVDADVRTGWLQVFPVFLRRFLGVFRQRWFSRLDLSEYDLIISVTGAEGKCVQATKPGAVHISYCHVPTQYYWQMYDDYVKDPGFGFLNPLVRFFFKKMVRPLREKDYEAAQKVDYFVTISEYARGLIAEYYEREATIVHPPVEVKDFESQKGLSEVIGLEFLERHTLDRRENRPNGRTSRGRQEYTSQKLKSGLILRPQKDFFDSYYITTSRQVNWKRLDLAVKACMKLRRPLLVIGEGPEHARLVKIAGNSEFVKFLPLLKREELAQYLAEARGYIFPSLEPFGIAPVEALASGCPVIAFGEGGALDYIKDGKNGVLFKKQTVSAVVDAILEFEKLEFDRAEITRGVKEFSVERFDTEMREFVKSAVKKLAKNEKPSGKS